MQDVRREDAERLSAARQGARGTPGWGGQLQESGSFLVLEVVLCCRCNARFPAHTKRRRSTAVEDGSQWDGRSDS
jgi:hypothetical protein